MTPQIFASASTFPMIFRLKCLYQSSSFCMGCSLWSVDATSLAWLWHLVTSKSMILSGQSLADLYVTYSAMPFVPHVRPQIIWSTLAKAGLLAVVKDAVA